MTDIDIVQIEKMIFVIRGQKTMLDSDLAKLYGVETKYLNRQVARNPDRFPPDFAFQLEEKEWASLRCQFVTSKEGKGGRRYLPYVFTENGIAMLSSVLNSKQAIMVNVAIMRIFTKLRSFLMLEQNLSDRMDRLEDGTNHIFRIVFERLDNLEEGLPYHSPKRKKIGLNSKED